MSLSNIPDWQLIKDANDMDIFWGAIPETEAFNEEIDLRSPENETEYYFCDHAGKPVFIPIEPEQYDTNTDQPIISEVIGYDDQGEEIWS